MRSGILRLRKRIDELEAFDPERVQKRWASEVTVLQKAIEETLTAVFGHNTVEYNRYTGAALLDHGSVSFIGGNSTPLPEVRRYLHEGKKEAIALLGQAVRGLEEEIEASGLPDSQVQRVFERKVFLVHGHDEGAREAVARFLEKIGFQTVILHERANKGRTIITKFREEAEDIGFAVVLLTPDDVGCALHKAAENGQRPRARQNVIFELGFFIGALGPDRVAALVKGDVERPSDFDGVVYISLDDGAWKQTLSRELEVAGYAIDWNKAMRS